MLPSFLITFEWSFVVNKLFFDLLVTQKSHNYMYFFVSCIIIAKDSYLDLEYEYKIIYHIVMICFYIDVQVTFHIW
jgi:hypothetical protein